MLFSPLFVLRILLNNFRFEICSLKGKFPKRIHVLVFNPWNPSPSDASHGGEDILIENAFQASQKGWYDVNFIKPINFIKGKNLSTGCFRTFNIPLTMTSLVNGNRYIFDVIFLSASRFRMLYKTDSETVFKWFHFRKTAANICTFLFAKKRTQSNWV